jgi:hypothetical protein
MQEFLKSTDIIDWQHPLVSEQSFESSNNLDNPIDIAKSCFEWVRDEIYHSSDFQMNPVTLKASEVLENKTGFCYAKSHLLPDFERSQKTTPHTIVFCCHQKFLNKTLESGLLQNRFQSKCSKKSHLI